jgi:adenylate cyclase
MAASASALARPGITAVLRDLRAQGALRVAQIRAVAATGFLGLAVYLGFVRDLQDWAVYVVPLAIYSLACAALLLAVTAPRFQLIHGYISPATDCAAVCAFQLRSMPLSPFPAGVAGWSLGLFVFIVLLSALSMQRGVVLFTGLVAWTCVGLLQRTALVGWGAVLASGLVLGLTAAALAWVMHKLDFLVERWVGAEADRRVRAISEGGRARRG